MSDQYGTKETEDVIQALATAIELYEAFQLHGSGALLTKGPEFVIDLFAAIAGFNKVHRELGELNDDDLERVKEKMRTSFDLETDDIEEFGEALFERMATIGDAIYEILELIRERRK